MTDDSGFFDTVPTGFLVLMGVVTIAVVAIFAFVIMKGVGQWSKNNKAPVETLPARVVAKRTQVNGGVGDTSAHTWYHVTFEFPDGERRELPVRAQDYATLVEGDQGMLTAQGTRFKGFERTITSA